MSTRKRPCTPAHLPTGIQTSEAITTTTTTTTTSTVTTNTAKVVDGGMEVVDRIYPVGEGYPSGPGPSQVLVLVPVLAPVLVPVLEY